MPFADYLHEAVCVPLGMTATRLYGLARADAVSSVDDLARFAAELRAPDAHGHPRRRHPRRLPRPRRHPARLRQAEAQRLGARLRDPRRQVPALDGRAQLAADVRALRAVGHVPVGRPGRRCGRGGAHRPRLRTVGDRGLAGLDGRGAGGPLSTLGPATATRSPGMDRRGAVLYRLSASGDPCPRVSTFAAYGCATRREATGTWRGRSYFFQPTASRRFPRPERRGSDGRRRTPTAPPP